MTELFAAFGSFFAWLEGTAVASAVGESLPLIASLSALHLVGFTLIMGGALVAGLRLLGVLLSKWPVLEVTRPASYAIAIGLVISVVTGALLFAWQAGAVAANGAFQVKMSLLAAATAFHFTLHRKVARKASLGTLAPSLVRIAGATGLVLWFGLALAACVFILFE